MKKEFVQFSLIAKGMTQLFFPYIEIAIHDLKSGCIVALFNNFSKRKVGEESLIEELKDFSELPDIFPTYIKTNWDGKKIKCVTTTIKNARGLAIGLFCMNLDISNFEMMHTWISEFTKQVTSKPTLLFKEDWKEKINVYISTYLKDKGLNISSLKKNEKKEVVYTLFKEGAFEAKYAADYIANLLNLSRATIYNYLKAF